MRHLPPKRVLRLTAGILLGLGVLGLLIHMRGENLAAQQEEAHVRAGKLVADASRDLKRWIKQDKARELEKLLQQLAARPGILDATLYDARGIPLAESEGAAPLENLLPIGEDNGSLPEQGKGRIQFVQEILDGDMTLGYLRITLEEAQLLAARGDPLKAVQDKQR